MRSKYTSLFLVIAALTASASLHAQHIVRFAGSGYGAGTAYGGYSGDGGLAYNAALFHPSAVVTFGYTNVYIADEGNHVVRKTDYTGNIYTVAGNDTAGNTGDGGPAVSARLNTPAGLAVDGSGNLYIADYSANVVRRVSTGGTISTVAGNGTAGYSGDGAQATDAQLNAPYGVAVDASGNLYIADANNNTIRKVDASGVITTFAGTGFGAGLGIGHGAYSGDGGSAVLARLSFPRSVALDAHGRLYIADAGNNVVRRVANDTITTFAGSGTRGFSGDGGSALAASMNFPASVAVSNAGELYIADEGNNSIRKVNTAGIISTFAGTATSGYYGDGGAANTAQFRNPTGLAVNGNDWLYIADYSNNVVRLIGEPTGINTVNNSDNGLKLYPNPATASFTIELPSTNATITITDMVGKVVTTQTAKNQQKLTIDLANYAAGNYIVKVVAGDKVYREQISVVK